MQLYMTGLTVQDMGKSLEFYRRLGVGFPEVGEQVTHVEARMQGEYTLFLDSKPISRGQAEKAEALDGYSVLLEFYMESRALVDAKYKELMDFGYESYRPPFEVGRIGMYFALVNDPDGHTVLLSADLQVAALPDEL